MDLDIININHNKEIYCIEFDKNKFSHFDIANIIHEHQIKYIKIINEIDRYILLINHYENFSKLFYHPLCEGMRRKRKK